MLDPAVADILRLLIITLMYSNFTPITSSTQNRISKTVGKVNFFSEFTASRANVFESCAHLRKKKKKQKHTFVDRGAVKSEPRRVPEGVTSRDVLRPPPPPCLPAAGCRARDDATSRSAPAQTRSLRSFHSSSHSEHSSHLCQCAKRFTYTFLAGPETPE